MNSNGETEKTLPEPTDRCIHCGDDTGIPSSVSIWERRGYIIGSGQLCKKCRDKFDEHRLPLKVDRGYPPDEYVLEILREKGLL